MPARLCVFAPAKLNLLLSVTGVRPDGYHELLSLVAPVDFGDTLWVTRESGQDRLSCTDAELPVGTDNLVLRAAAAFRARCELASAAAFHLEKRIPTGAGLGGGSSDAAAALLALNTLAPRPLPAAQLAEAAAAVGSDVPLFLSGEPCILRGRGERIEQLAKHARDALRGRAVLILKPHFGISTAWAYSQIRASGKYDDAARWEASLAAWVARPAAEPPLYNRFEFAVARKYPALPLLSEHAAENAGAPLHLTGSGSACFLMTEDPRQRQAVRNLAREALGEMIFLIDTRIR